MLTRGRGLGAEIRTRRWQRGLRRGHGGTGASFGQDGMVIAELRLQREGSLRRPDANPHANRSDLILKFTQMNASC